MPGIIKRTARLLFRRLAKEGKLATFGFLDDDWSAHASRMHTSARSSAELLAKALNTTGPFRLWCDDLHAGNILVGEWTRVLGIIDWDFAYVEQVQFTLDPPWWLFLAEPEKWPGGLEAWASAYERCLEIWIRSLERREQEESVRDLANGMKHIKLSGSDAGDVQAPAPLASQHRQSWDQGQFWLNYAARNSWVFDAVYWKFLDQRFFGASESSPRTGHEDHLWKSRVC